MTSVPDIQMGGENFDIEEALTDKNLSKNLVDNLINLNSDSREMTYVSVPSVDTKTVVVSPQDVWEYYERITKQLEESEETRYYNYFNPDELNDEYQSFKQSAKKEVNYDRDGRDQNLFKSLWT